eukprot:3955684-Pyramimonas_sp.AAC.1
MEAHGQMPGKQQDAAMDAFANGDCDVLICTTIVEAVRARNPSANPSSNPSASPSANPSANTTPTLAPTLGGASLFSRWTKRTVSVACRIQELSLIHI